AGSQWLGALEALEHDRVSLNRDHALVFVLSRNLSENRFALFGLRSRLRPCGSPPGRKALWACAWSSARLRHEVPDNPALPHGRARAGCSFPTPRYRPVFLG